MERRAVNLTLIICAVMLILLTIADIGPLPSWLLAAERTGTMPLSSFQQLQLEQAIRTTVLQAIGGLLLVSGAVATWRQVVTASQTLSLNQSTKATDTFARAVEDLGSVAIVTRIGGIYTLDRIARDEPSERPRIGALLAAFARRSPENPLNDIEHDVQTAMTVLVTGRYTNLNLDDARLRSASLAHTNLSRASLRRAVLAHANLTGADLSGACLAAADLREADLRLADLRASDLRAADLSGTRLDGIKADSETQWPKGSFQP